MSTMYSSEAMECIANATKIIDDNTEFGDQFIHIKSSGSAGIIAEAATLFKKVADMYPDDAQLHFAYASCLLHSLQGPVALNEMKKIIKTHPDFDYAQIAIRGWEKWESIFTLPFIVENSKIPRIISSTLPIGASGLFALRQGYRPISAIFYRNDGTINNLEALRTADIKTTTIVSKISEPQVIGIYTRVFDDPKHPFTIEVTGTPFFPRGDRIRTNWEYYAIHKELTFYVINAENHIIFKRILPFSETMKKANRNLLNMFKENEGHEISIMQMLNAIRMHQNYLSTDFAF
jgi:hypothetical protein